MDYGVGRNINDFMIIKKPEIQALLDAYYMYTIQTNRFRDHQSACIKLFLCIYLVLNWETENSGMDKNKNSQFSDIKKRTSPSKLTPFAVKYLPPSSRPSLLFPNKRHAMQNRITMGKT